MRPTTVLTMSALTALILLTGCTSTANGNPATADSNILQSEGNENTIISDKGENTEKKAPLTEDDLDGMELSNSEHVTMEQLIQQLQEDNIVSGTPNDLQDGVANAIRTTQIGGAIIVEFDKKDLRAFKEAYLANSLHLQGKDYPIVAVQGSFILLLTDETDPKKAADSFTRVQGDDGRLIIF